MIRTSGFTPHTQPSLHETIPSSESPEIGFLKAMGKNERKRSFRYRNARMMNLFLFLFLVGMMYGALFLRVGSDGFMSRLAHIHEDYLFQRQEQAVLLNFLDTLISASLFLLGSFVAGFCAIGHPVAISIPFIKGLGVGCYMGYLYLNYGMTGVAYSALLVVPGTVISVLALALSCRESWRMSSLILLSFIRETGKINKNTLSLYLKKHIVLFIFLLVAAAVDSILNFIFAGMFSLG